ncbi:hypothetical protein [Flavobacterium sp.]|uniref:hypothetical protein n=1 Tax=Flavobacterium sp. TaxID=239 RepID=UPI0040485EA0
MKTYYPFTRKNALFSIFGLLAILTTSCGSYQNSSYYDNDGVYGSDRPNTQTENKYSEQNLEKSNQYATQFRNMQDDYVYFTDVDNYNSTTQDTVVTVYRNESNNNYAGWGNNSSQVSINYYNNDWGWTNWGWNNWYSPYWGYSNVGWGWNSWYGGGWGLGWNSWYGPGWNSWYGPGWGWNSWYGAGWGWNGYYGNNWGYNGYRGRDVVYNGGRRGGTGYYNPSSGRNGNYTNRRSDTPRPNFNGTRNNIRTQNNGTRSSVRPRENATSTPRNTNYSTPRNNTSTPRNNTSTPRSNYSSPRSSSGGSFGGGSSGGGGRSGGGSRGGRG